MNLKKKSKLSLLKKSTDFQSGSGLSGANEFQYRFIAQWRLTGPIAADERKHSMLDRIPFRRAGRIVTDFNLKAETIAKSKLHLMFPEACSILDSRRFRKVKGISRIQSEPKPGLLKISQKAVAQLIQQPDMRLER